MAIDNGLVSIIIPVYNCEQYVEECIDSVINQTYHNIEVIIIDDGSTDESGKLIQKYVGENVRYFKMSNAGVSVARNCGMEMSKGEYLLFVDGDDSIDTRLVESLMKEMKEDVDIVCSSYKILETEQAEKMFSHRIEASTIEEKQLLIMQLMDKRIGHEGWNVTAIGVPWGKLFRKKFINDNKIIFNPSLRRMQDNIFCTEAFIKARKIIYAELYLYRYRIAHISSADHGMDYYYRILVERKAIFDANPEYFTDDIRRTFYDESMRILYKEINYEINNKNFLDAIKSIKEMTQREIYKECIQKCDRDNMILKHKIALKLADNNMIGLLLIMMKLRRLK